MNLYQVTARHRRSSSWFSWCFLCLHSGHNGQPEAGADSEYWGEQWGGHLMVYRREEGQAVLLWRHARDQLWSSPPPPPPLSTSRTCCQLSSTNNHQQSVFIKQLRVTQLHPVRFGLSELFFKDNEWCWNVILYTKILKCSPMNSLFKTGFHTFQQFW